MRASVLLLPFLFLAAACGGDSGTKDTAEPDTSVEVDTVVDSINLFEVEVAEVEVTPPSGDFGDPCLGNTDCESGWCVDV